MTKTTHLGVGFSLLGFTTLKSPTTISWDQTPNKPLAHILKTQLLLLGERGMGGTPAKVSLDLRNANHKLVS